MSKKKKIIIISVVVAVVAIIAAIIINRVYNNVMVPEREYKDACDLRDSGEYVKAAEAFLAMGDYKDAAKQVSACNYKEAERLEAEGRNAAAAMLYGSLGDYKESRSRSFKLWDDIAVRDTFDIEAYYMIGLHEDGTVVSYYRDGDDATKLDTTNKWSNIVEVHANEFDYVGLKYDGTVILCDKYGVDSEIKEGWSDIVSIDACDDAFVGLKSDGTVLYEYPTLQDEDYGQGNVSGWRNIVSVKCSAYITAGLRSNGTVIATGDISDSNKKEIESWTDIVSIAVGYDHVAGLKSDGSVVCVGNNSINVSSWENVAYIDANCDCCIAVTSNGDVLHSGDTYGHDGCPDWTSVTAVIDTYSGCYALNPNGTVKRSGDRPWFWPVSKWENIRQPKVRAFYDLDDQITVDVETEKGTFTPEEAPFTNKYGTATTKCAHSGCNAYIASSGDTNCCTYHSNRCGECYCYIDGDAMFCMSCIEDAMD